jgi:hypothetical protein
MEEWGDEGTRGVYERGFPVDGRTNVGLRPSWDMNRCRPSGLRDIVIMLALRGCKVSKSSIGRNSPDVTFPKPAQNCETCIITTAPEHALITCIHC